MSDYTLSYAGTTLNDDLDSGIYFELGAPIRSGLSTKGTDGNPPTHDGVFARPRRFMRRTVPLTGVVSGDTPEEYFANWDEVEALFDLRGHGDLVVVIGGTTYTLDVRPVNMIPNEQLGNLVAYPTVELHSYEDADWDVESPSS